MKLHSAIRHLIEHKGNLLSKITTWLHQELIQPARQIWQLTLKYFALFIIASALLQAITFLIIPSVWLPTKIEHLALKKPENQINLGKTQNIVLQQGYKKYLARCTWQIPEIKQLCESAAHHQQLNIQSVQFIYLSTTFQLSKGSKKEVFIQAMSLVTDHTATARHIHATTQQQQQWLQAQYQSTHIIRMLLLINMLYMALASWFKIRHRSHSVPK